MADNELAKIKEVLEQRVAEDEAILRSIGHGLVVTDAENKVVMINNAGAALLGWKMSEVIGKPVSLALPMERERGDGILTQEEKVESVLTTASANIAGTSTEYYILRQDGTKFPAEINASSIILDKKVVGAVIVFRDRSDEKDAERAQSDFIAISSHQLRTPLGSMKWNLEMMADEEFGKVPEEAKPVLQQLLESNERMIDLVNDLLAVSRIKQHRLADKPEETDVMAIINKVITEVDGLAKPKSVTFKMEQIDETLPKLYLDPHRFAEVMMNLITNAIKYNKTGGIVIIRVLRNKEVVRLSVSDTGIGISPHDQERLFTRFFRADNAVKGDTDGTGLGLFVVKSYVESWGGKTWCESELSKGSTFYVEIPEKPANLLGHIHYG